MTKSRNSIEVVKVEIVIVVEVGVKVAENLEEVEEAEWRETRMVNSRGHNWPACWDQVGTGVYCKSMCCRSWERRLSLSQ